MELLTDVLPPRLFRTVTPEKIVELMRLGEGEEPLSRVGFWIGLAKSGVRWYESPSAYCSLAKERTCKHNRAWTPGPRRYANTCPT
jgi:hypothetical protein